MHTLQPHMYRISFEHHTEYILAKDHEEAAWLAHDMAIDQKTKLIDVTLDG